MKKRILIAMMIATCVFAGCGKKEEPEPVIQLLESESIAEPEEAEEEPGETVNENIITNRQVVNGQMQSYLTGEWKDEKVVKRRSLAVMIPNNKPALPQYGLSKASIIYEAPVEGRITRLMGIFEDYDDLDHIGPVRSSRDYYIYEAMAYDSIYVNWGLAVPYVSDLINSDRIDNVSYPNTGIANPATEAFGRISRSGYATEFTGYMFINGYNQAVERLGYATEYHPDRFTEAFPIASDGHRAEYDGFPAATKLYPGGTGSNSGGYGNANPYFTYNEEDGLYYRYEYGGKQIDEMNGEQLAVSNVIFKICHGEVRDDHDYLAFGVHGTGDAYVFTNGKVIKATWERPSDYEPNRFFDENGNEIVFNQGKTWMCNIWKEYAEFMSWE